MDITFDSINTNVNMSSVCSLCGALVCDWHKSRPNQDIHRSWHERLDRNIMMGSLGFPPGLL